MSDKTTNPNTDEVSKSTSKLIVDKFASMFPPSGFISGLAQTFGFVPVLNWLRDFIADAIQPLIGDGIKGFMQNLPNLGNQTETTKTPAETPAKDSATKKPETTTKDSATSATKQPEATTKESVEAPLETPTPMSKIAKALAQTNGRK